MATKTLANIGNHATADYLQAQALPMGYKHASKLTYTFENFFHPFVGELIEKLNKEALSGLLDPEFHEKLGDLTRTPSSALPGKFYTPNSSSELVEVIFHNMAIDVESGGPYANYNWELFFHIPLTIAVHLSKNQRFAEAQRWFHFIFDPTARDKRYWRFTKFRQGGPGKQIDALLALLSKPPNECTDKTEKGLIEDVRRSYQNIQDKPFHPHAVAALRPQAYMYCVVMKYLDNLVAWGDHLFRQDTLESMNEATQLYVLAANILGKRPEKIPLKGKAGPKTFAQLKQRLESVEPERRDPMGNALVELEGVFPFNLGVPAGGAGAEAAAPLFGIGRTLYFCIPRNDNLLAYWDTVADRLFKIRHCMNIQGVVRPLALFDPPLDPGMLVKAAAAGIDIGAIVAGLNQPVSPVRAQLLIQKALELCAEVRGLGSALLQAIEKGDAERLALLRQGHETKIQELQQEVRFLQWKQAEEATQSLLKSRAIALERYKYYLRLMGQSPDGNLAPDTLSLDRRELTEENFDEAYDALVGQYEKEIPLQAYPKLSLEGGGSPAGEAGAEGPGKLSLITAESDEIGHLTTARDLGLAASVIDATGAACAFIPDFSGDLHFWGMGGTVRMNVGTAILKVLEITAKGLQMTAAWEREQAGINSRTATYTRRADDWTFQANLAGRELRQIGRQIISSLIAEQIAHREYQNIQQQIEHSQEVDRFLRDKFSNVELYAWMQGELSRLYYEYYRFAFDVARRAEQTMKRELMRPELDDKTLVKFNYWDGGRRGLLSGEALYLDVKRMEMAYHEHNLREYELTKHVSLLQVDPLALISLRATGRCIVRLPEALFDMDGPGHYCRRIKTVALSVPCVTGPYAGVNCKLTLLKSSIRKSPLLNGSYAREDSEDTRFQDYFGSIQSVVTSSAQQDSGLFETNLKDERYLPFENAGAIDSEWQLELPANPSADDPAQFDYDTIADCVLHIRYTARDGGEQLRTAALQEIKDLIDAGQSAGSVRLFSLRHEFPTEWGLFAGTKVEGAASVPKLSPTLRAEHFPYWSKSRLRKIKRVALFTEDAKELTKAGSAELITHKADGSEEKTTFDDLTATAEIPLPELPSTFSLKFNFQLGSNTMKDVWLALTWGKE